MFVAIHILIFLICMCCCLCLFVQYNMTKNMLSNVFFFCTMAACYWKRCVVIILTDVVTFCIHYMQLVSPQPLVSSYKRAAFVVEDVLDCSYKLSPVLKNTHRAVASLKHLSSEKRRRWFSESVQEISVHFTGIKMLDNPWKTVCIPT